MQLHASLMQLVIPNPASCSKSSNSSQPQYLPYLISTTLIEYIKYKTINLCSIALSLTSLNFTPASTKSHRKQVIHAIGEITITEVAMPSKNIHEHTSYTLASIYAILFVFVTSLYCNLLKVLHYI